MLIKSKSNRKVLFVDDSPDFLDMIERVLAGLNKDSCQFLGAPNAGKAMAMMEDHVVDLMIIDLHMPGVDGLKFLHLLQKRFTDIPKVVWTALPDKESEAACLNNGAEIYLEKPKSLNELEGVFATIEELSKWHGDQGFRGIMRQITLSEVLQMECLNKNSSILEVSSGFNRGQVFIRDGELIHAEGGRHKGQPALAYLLSLKGGEFNVRPFSEPSEITMSGSWEGLLMEAAQQSDEGAELSTNVNRLPPDWGTSPELPQEMEALAMAAEPSEEFSGENTAPFNEEILAPQVEEMLVSAVGNDVLYEWQCPQREARIAFMDVLTSETQKLSPLLGKFERFDLITPKDHLLVRVRTDHRIFLRTCCPPTSAQ